MKGMLLHRTEKWKQSWKTQIQSVETNGKHLSKQNYRLKLKNKMKEDDLCD